MINIYSINPSTGRHSLCLSIPFHDYKVCSLAELSNGKLLSSSKKNDGSYSLTILPIYLPFNPSDNQNDQYDDYIIQTNIFSKAISKCVDEELYNVINLSNNRFAAFGEGNIIKEDDRVFIRIYNYDIKEIGVLEGHYHQVVSAIEVKNKLISCGNDDEVRIWNLNQYQCECVINKISTSSNIISYGNRIIFGGKHKLLVFNILSMKIEKTINNSSIGQIIKIMITRDGNIVMINAKGVLFLVEIKFSDDNNNYARIKRISKEKRNIISDLCVIDNKTFIICGGDFPITIWNY